MSVPGTGHDETARRKELAAERKTDAARSAARASARTFWTRRRHIGARVPGTADDETARRKELAAKRKKDAARRAAWASARTFWARRRHIGMIFTSALVITFGFILSQMLPPLLKVGEAGQDSRPPEVTLTLWLVIGAAFLLVMIMIVALTSNFVVGRRAVPGALGLPDGSISAIIALMLLLIFAISSVFLFNQIRAGEGEGFISTGVTVDALRELPQERVIQVEAENPTAAPANQTFRVKLAAAHPASTDFAQSTALTVGTLLTAVAGFYFGQRGMASGLRFAKTMREPSAADAAAAASAVAKKKTSGAPPAPDAAHAKAAAKQAAKAKVAAERAAAGGASQPGGVRRPTVDVPPADGAAPGDVPPPH